MDFEDKVRIVKTLRESPSIYHEATSLLRKALQNPDAQSNQSATEGQVAHLLDLQEVANIRDFNPHHSACLNAKARAHVGLGHRADEIDEVLNQVCMVSWQDLMDAVAEDFWETGNGYIEVSRNDQENPNVITGLFHVPAETVYVQLEESDNLRDFHYAVLAGDSEAEHDRLMAPFGQMQDFIARFSASRSGRSASLITGEIVPSEILHFRLPSKKSRWYGYPDYVAAIPSIELVQCMSQFEFDFFFNRGVPEFILFLIGRSINAATWEEVDRMIKAQQGLGNSHKTAAIQIPGDPESVQVQIEKLALDETASAQRFVDTNQELAMNIVTAHGVPPLIGGILIPAKAGGMNEGPNSLMMFQKLKIGHAQRLWSQCLANTIGRPEQRVSTETGVVAAPTAAMFLGEGAQPMDPVTGMPQQVSKGNGFNTVLDGMTLGAMNTMAAMREPLTGSGRNPEDGLLSGTDDRPANDPRRTR